jgi:predicted phosphodiesterase
MTKTIFERATLRALSCAGAAALALLGGCAGSGTGGGAYDFGVVGDTPYTHVQAAEFKRVMAALDSADLAFVIHVGDFEFDPRPYNRDPSKADMPCTDENFAAVHRSFDASKNPFILTPGDNDWTDCVHLKAQKVDPLERLEKIRALFYPQDRSLGQRTIAVTHQSADAGHAKFRENLTWSIGGVRYVTLHMVGSNNNLNKDPRNVAEHAERTAANDAWLKKAFAAAKAENALGLVIMTQANPGFENQWNASMKRRYASSLKGLKAPAKREPTGFDSFLATVAAEMEAYDRPTLFIHGDTHLFRINRPLVGAKTKQPIQNFTRVETFGWPDSHWVKITVDPADSQLFRIRTELVPENLVNRKSR